MGKGPQRAVIYERGKNNADPPRSPPVRRGHPRHPAPAQRGRTRGGVLEMPLLGSPEVKAAFGFEMRNQSFLDPHAPLPGHYSCYMDRVICPVPLGFAASRVGCVEHPEVCTPNSLLVLSRNAARLEITTSAFLKLFNRFEINYFGTECSLLARQER